MKLYFKEMRSPVGKLRLVADNDSLVAVLWEKEIQGRVKLGEMERADDHKILVRAETQLKEYFANERKAFDLPLNPVGTSFQKKVWRGLQKIPFGQVSSYGDLAKRVRSPKGSRAVGSANGRNPISIIVPCHRVIGKDGKLTGFAGGLAIKEKLLKLEGNRDYR